MIRYPTKIDASRRGKTMLNSSRDKNEGTYRSGEGGLPTTPTVEKSWCREGVREGTQGYQLRLETAPVLLCRFLIIGIEL